MVRWIFQDQVTSGIPSLKVALSCFCKCLVIVRHRATALFRLSQAAGSVHPVLGGLVKQLNHFMTGADIAWTVTCGPGLVLHHPTGVVVGHGVSIGLNCRVQQGITLGGSGAANDGSPCLGDNVVLGAGCRVLGAISVGDDSVIGANAVVIKDVPSQSIAVGVPASSRPRTYSMDPPPTSA